MMMRLIHLKTFDDQEILAISENQNIVRKMMNTFGENATN